MYTPIPMTVPYSLFFESSCAETAGQRQMSAKKVRKMIEREDARRRDFPRDGRRCEPVIVVDDDEQRREMLLFTERKSSFI